MERISPTQGPTPAPVNQIDNPASTILIVLAAAVFFLGFYAYIGQRLRQAEDSQSQQRHPQGGESTWTSDVPGLPLHVTRSLPSHPYSHTKTLCEVVAECPICLSEFHDKTLVKLIPNCRHVFHPDCLDKWLTIHATCPVCRAALF